MKESKDPGRIQIHSSEGQVILIQDSNHFATDPSNYHAEYFRYEIFQIWTFTIFVCGPYLQWLFSPTDVAGAPTKLNTDMLNR